jgi:hypothetical protein
VMPAAATMTAMVETSRVRMGELLGSQCRGT